MPPPPPAGGPPPGAEVNQKPGQAVMIWAIGAFCIFGWEWIICLPQEYRRIWRRKLTSMSLLYIANRYFGILQLSFVISLLSGVWSHEACKYVYFWEPVGALISTVLSQMILGARVYALFGQNKAVGILLFAILVGQVSMGGVAISTTSPPTSPQMPCSAVMGPDGWLITFWSIPLLYDAVTFALTAWKAYGFWRKDISTPLISVIWRDGVFYFFAITSMNLTNVLIFLTAPQALRAINLTPTLALEVILSCRLFLNIRNTHDRTTSNPKLNSNESSNPGGRKPNSLPSSKTTSGSTKVAVVQEVLRADGDSPKPPSSKRARHRPTEIKPRPFTPGKSEWLASPTQTLKLEPNRYMPPEGFTDKPFIGEHPQRMV